MRRTSGNAATHGRASLSCARRISRPGRITPLAINIAPVDERNRGQDEVMREVARVIRAKRRCEKKAKIHSVRNVVPPVVLVLIDIAKTTPTGRQVRSRLIRWGGGAWLNAPVSKTGVPFWVPGVRIPPPPPTIFAECLLWLAPGKAFLFQKTHSRQASTA